MALQWWQTGVFYQIYPRSYGDSNGDGIGDLDGITAHLDYLNDGTPNSLGVDAIWLSPIYPSPLEDWGYDVSDFCGIHPELGDMAAFDCLLKEAHRRNIRVIVDLVPCHTSDRHPWFVESRASRDNPKRDWFLWVPGTPDKPPTNWWSNFGGSAWTYDEKTAAWYLHMFLSSQPDLNYRNPKVVDAMHDVMKFWMGRGADGFRIDVVHGMIKDDKLRDNPLREEDDPDLPWNMKGMQLPLYSTDRPEVHDVIRGFRSVANSFGERVLVGEAFPRKADDLALYLRPDELHLAFNFRFLLAPWEAGRFRAAVDTTQRTFGPGSWPTWTLSNHDIPRHFSRYTHGGDPIARARVAAMMLMTLRGTPFIYYGEEIGMPDATPVGRARDPVGRDWCRTPMQWSDAPSGGFSTSTNTWLPCGDFKAVNVAKQTDDPSSLLSLYRRLIWLRKNTPTLLEGNFSEHPGAPEDCFVFHRETPTQKLLVALNFTAEPRKIASANGKIVLSTHLDRAGDEINGSLELRPDEGVILEVSK
ncbi:MAG TPA: alpha-amylase family glycosyl hydrolase [Candidatus Binataceae bacterium]|nr:alpha-amylase family glycosyl hydrolase [Candidatus Binataceae bacterium]